MMTKVRASSPVMRALAWGQKWIPSAAFPVSNFVQAWSRRAYVMIESCADQHWTQLRDCSRHEAPCVSRLAFTLARPCLGPTKTRGVRPVKLASPPALSRSTSLQYRRFETWMDAPRSERHLLHMRGLQLEPFPGLERT
jgi:hypothetical protein